MECDKVENMLRSSLTLHLKHFPPSCLPLPLRLVSDNIPVYLLYLTICVDNGGLG